VQDRELRRDAANGCTVLTLSSKARSNGRMEELKGEIMREPSFQGWRGSRTLDTLVLLIVEMF
jgi:hypothetical protein